MRRVYISGPMKGYVDSNYPAFEKAAARLRKAGYTVVSPHELIPEKPGDYDSHMRADIKGLMDCDEIAMLPGWERSSGAHLEMHIAARVGIKVRMFGELVAD